MRRPVALINKNEEDASDSLSNMGSQLNHAYLDDASSPYLRTTSHLSDEDGLSESSKKIRKKRNTYQKIDDDIRVHLLEAVKNGETLKSAAKRYKINYSSAKSILHTYRKEGRILKKSAQERSTKKKTVAEDEWEQPAKVVKTSKKESVKIIPEPIIPLAERVNSVSTSASLTEQSSPVCSTSLLSDSKVEDQVTNVPATVENVECETNQPKLFDNMFANNVDYNFSAEQMLGEAPEQTNSNYFSNEFDSFNDIMANFQSKIHNNEEFFQDPGNFLCTKDFNTPTLLDKNNNKMVFDYAGATTNGFLEDQNLFKTPFRKSSFCYNGSPSPFRKGSFDFF
jgi:transposase